MSKSLNNDLSEGYVLLPDTRQWKSQKLPHLENKIPGGFVEGAEGVFHSNGVFPLGYNFVIRCMSKN